MIRVVSCGWGLLLVALLSACNPPAAPVQRGEAARLSYRPTFRPNILWLVAEDLSPFLPMYGDSAVATPHLSRLAAEGVVYTRVFSPSGVCAPSRAAIATGMYPTHIGAMHMRTGGQVKYLPAEIIPYEATPHSGVFMHSEYLRRAGYYCTNNAKEDYQFRKSLMAWDESSNQAHWRNRQPGQPFFAIFNFGVTHESQIWVRQHDSLWIDTLQPLAMPPYLPDNAVARRDLRRMYSNIAEMDDQVGRVLAQLEADGLLDSTIIFWYADHGGPLPRMKRQVYDSGIRLPMIIRYPDAWQAGTRDDRLISFVDFLPTLLSITGQAPPGYLDGQAFAGEYRAPQDRRYIHAAADRFDEVYTMKRAVRDARFKYIRNFRAAEGDYEDNAYRKQQPIMAEMLRLRDAGQLDSIQMLWFCRPCPEEMLFDTETDPHEIHNLAGDPAYADKLAELRAECLRWMEAVGDKGSMPEPDFIASMWPGKVQPVTQPPVVQQQPAGWTLSSATPGASLGYQILAPDSLPGPRWQVYTGPVAVPPGQTLAAVAHRLGYQPSEVVRLDQR